MLRQTCLQAFTLFAAANNAKRLSDIAQAVGRNRLELLALELDQEKRHVQASLALSVVGGFVLVVGLAFGAAALVLWAPPERRVLVLGVAAGVFLLLGLACLVLARKQLRAKPRPLESLLRGFGLSLKDDA